MADWVHAAERAYVAAATGGAVAAAPELPTREQLHRAVAAAGAIASHYLAVGTPRSFSVVIEKPSQAMAVARAIEAHRTWFNPRDLRFHALGDDVDRANVDSLAELYSGRVVSLDEALACDVVNLYASDLRILPSQLRRGTHVNALSLDVFDPELLTLATVVREAALPGLAAGLVDGRQLDELTLFAADGAPIALSAV